MRMVVVDIYEVEFDPSRDDPEEEADDLVDPCEDKYFWGRYVFRGSAQYVAKGFEHRRGERRR